MNNTAQREPNVNVISDWISFKKKKQENFQATVAYTKFYMI